MTYSDDPNHFADKGPSSQSYGFPNSRVEMWELDHKGWALKNWCFWIVVLEKTLRVSWTARRSNKSILKEINPQYSLEGLTLKLKLQYFGHLMRRANSLEKTLMLGKTEGRGGWAAEDEIVREHHRLNGHEFEQTPRDSEVQGNLACCSPWGCRVRRVLATEKQQNGSQNSEKHCTC